MAKSETQSLFIVSGGGRVFTAAKNLQLFSPGNGFDLFLKITSFNHFILYCHSPSSLLPLKCVPVFHTRIKDKQRTMRLWDVLRTVWGCYWVLLLITRVAGCTRGHTELRFGMLCRLYLGMQISGFVFSNSKQMLMSGNLYFQFLRISLLFTCLLVCCETEHDLKLQVMLAALCTAHYKAVF